MVAHAESSCQRLDTTARPRQTVDSKGGYYAPSSWMSHPWRYSCLMVGGSAFRMAARPADHDMRMVAARVNG